jgi:hypothetical protein
MFESQPVLWWKLINEAEELRARTGWGLASVWGHIHREDYEKARRTLDELAELLLTRSWARPKTRT